MFKTISFPKALYFRFFCPTLQPVAVVKRIIAALDEQHSQTILMPFYVHFLPYIGHLPSFGRDLIQWVRRLLLWPAICDSFFSSKIVGADYTMVNFVKSSGFRPEEDPPPTSDVNKKLQ